MKAEVVGWLAMGLAIGLAIVGVTFGAFHLGRSDAAADCERMGFFISYTGKVYTCEKRYK